MQFFLYSALKLVIRTQNNGPNRTCFLAVTTIYALCHVYIVSCCSSRVVGSRFGFYGYCLSGTSYLTKLTSNTSLFSTGISSQGMLSSELRGSCCFFKRIVYCPFSLKSGYKSHINRMIQYFGE